MDSTRKLTALVLLLSTMIIGSCGSTAKVTGSWKADDQAQSFDKLAIIGITPRPEGRKAIEDKLEVLLLDQGINAVAGLTFLPPQASKGNTSLELLLKFLESEKVDGVLTVSVLEINDNKRYVPGTYVYYPWNDTYFTDYYGQMNNYIYVPGYSTSSLDVFLEANLYTFPEGRLIWSAQTKSIDVYDLDRGSSEVARALVRNLLINNVINSE